MPWATPPCTWPSTIIGLMTTSHVVHRDIALNLDLAGIGIHLDDADVRAEGVGEVGRIVEVTLLQAWLHPLRQTPAEVGLQRHVLDRDCAVGLPATEKRP